MGYTSDMIIDSQEKRIAELEADNGRLKKRGLLYVTALRKIKVLGDYKARMQAEKALNAGDE